MFNVAVIHVKDIGKYIVRIAIVIAVLTFCFNWLGSAKERKKQSGININLGQTLFSHTFLSCLDMTIPGMKEIEWKQAKEESTIQKILKEELLAASHLKVQENVETEVDETQEGENLAVAEQQKETTVPETAQTQVLENNVPERYTNSYAGVNIKNETDFGLTEEILAGEVQIDNPKRVLIYHTHTCESYTPSESYSYEMTGNYRTTDLNYNVARVGTELAKILEQKQYTVIHDTTYHDFPAYSGSYDRSYTTVSNLLAGQEKTDIIFDLHRDSIGDSSYAPTVKIGEEYAAQLMFVIGTNGGGLEHPDWILNLRAAIKIQAKANEKYPGLFKPIVLRNSRYNQNLGRAAAIIEVGATGNTLEQCMTSMKYLAEVMEEAF